MWSYTALCQDTTKQCNNSIIPTGMAWGKVFEETTARPIQGAQVNLYRGESLAASHKTNLYGEYWFRPQKRSNYTLVVQASGYSTRSITLSIQGKSQLLMPSIFLPLTPTEKKV